MTLFLAFGVLNYMDYYEPIFLVDGSAIDYYEVEFFKNWIDDSEPSFNFIFDILGDVEWSNINFETLFPSICFLYEVISYSKKIYNKYLSENIYGWEKNNLKI